MPVVAVTRAFTSRSSWARPRVGPAGTAKKSGAMVTVRAGPAAQVVVPADARLIVRAVRLNNARDMRMNRSLIAAMANLSLRDGTAGGVPDGTVSPKWGAISFMSARQHTSAQILLCSTISFTAP